MSHTFSDDDLRTWEVYPSGGRFGLPDNAKMVFYCLSEPHLRPRFVRTKQEDDDVQAALERASDAELLDLFRRSEPLD